MFEKLVELIYTDVTETNKKKVSGGFVITYRVLVLIFAILMLIILRAIYSYTSDTNSKISALIRDSQEAKEYKVIDMREHIEMRNEFSKFKENDFADLKSRVDVIAANGSEITRSRLNLLEFKVFGHSNRQ